jgi:hypothetical protein
MTTRQYDAMSRAVLLAACMLGAGACLLSLLGARATSGYPALEDPPPAAPAPAPVHHMRGWPTGPAGQRA